MKEIVEELKGLVHDLKERIEKKDKEGQKKVEEEIKKALQEQRKASFVVQSEEEKKQLRKRAADLYLASAILKKPVEELAGNAESELRKALDAATSGKGSEWIETAFSDEIMDRVALELKVASVFPQIDMKRSPLEVPIKGTLPSAKLKSASLTDTTPTGYTGKVTLTAKTLYSYIPIDVDLEEDAIFPILPVVKEDLALALSAAIENAILNGDTAATHMDADVTASDDPRKAFLGLRAYAVDNSLVVDASTFNETVLRNMRKEMGKYGADPNQLVWITGIAGYTKMLNLSNVLTVDKYGPNATLLTGELAKFDGIPVIVSEYVREDLNASGVYDGTTTTNTVIYLVNKNAWVYGVRRKVTVEAEKIAKDQATHVVATIRVAFRHRVADGEKIAVIGVTEA